MKPSLNSRRILLLAVLLAVVTAFLVYRYLESASSKVTAVPTVEMAVASRDVPAGTTMTAHMVTMRSVPEGAAIPGAAGSAAEVVGAVTKERLFPGAPILQAELYQKGQYNAGLPYLVPPGMRALTVSVDALNDFAGLLQAGDRVDVIAVLPTSMTDKKTPYAVTAVEDVAVLATGTATEPAPGGQKPKPQNTATLALTPAQAEEMALLTGPGKADVRFSLRPAGNSGTSPIPPFDPASVWGAPK